MEMQKSGAPTDQSLGTAFHKSSRIGRVDIISHRLFFGKTENGGLHERI